jgi:hypothetical protein
MPSIEMIIIIGLVTIAVIAVIVGNYEIYAVRKYKKMKFKPPEV